MKFISISKLSKCISFCQLKMTITRKTRLGVKVEEEREIGIKKGKIADNLDLRLKIILKTSKVDFELTAPYRL